MIGKGNYASLHRIMEEMNTDFKYLSGDVDWQDLLIWVGKYVSFIGAPNMYIDKTTGEHPLTPHIEITEHQGDLPVDFVSVLPGGVRDSTTHEVYLYGSDSFQKSYSKSARTVNETDTSLKVEKPISYVDLKTYMINDFKIHVSEEDPVIEMAYTAFKIDDKGFPMIPDNDRIIEGCKWFIANKVGHNLWGAKLLDDKTFDYIQIQEAFWMKSASNAARTMTPDEMETFTRAWVRLLPVVHMHNYSFRFAGVREDLNIGS